ncbi:MAG: hypothetical protein PHI98_09705 [Eubacteriales bacterium]|nr:hypothetical protein [Eubacteriales bacterium]
MEQYMQTYDSFLSQNGNKYVPTSRFQVMSNVYLPASDVDMRTGRLQADRHRRCRTQSMLLEQERLDREEEKMMESILRESKKGGVRISKRMMVLVLAFVLFFCGLCLLLQQSMIADRQKAINIMERSINNYRSQNASLEEQIADASDSTTICYAASQNLNMIPAEAADAIHLVAVNTRPMENRQTVTANAQSAETGEAPVTVIQETATAESTNVPVTANGAH